ncbi:hypothetical protein [Cupriavidus taiwanensis]|uniref:hypothetical protein n=1 Tax=Cupriavidus taiwanensis TaxID=164546 RepID=UPI000E10AE02|nr:hypothetical protein [Cupriavidus taiwanensis]SPA50629.1 protein of unknown function [Cupriavidus taiwanensis]
MTRTVDRIRADHEANQDAQRVIDVTPTWSAVLPYLLVGIESGNAEGKRIAREELARMARAADLYNASRKGDAQ